MEEETCHQNACGGQDVAAGDSAGDGRPCIHGQRYTAQGRVMREAEMSEKQRGKQNMDDFILVKKDKKGWRYENTNKTPAL